MWVAVLIAFIAGYPSKLNLSDGRKNTVQNVMIFARTSTPKD
jgi:hypothetical protein